MAPMNRIVMHHSAGFREVSAVDKEHYHRIVDGDGVIHSGDHQISDNTPGRPLSPGTYAAHTLNLNSGAIGLAMSCMAEAKWSAPFDCEAFPTEKQIDSLTTEAARLCREYSILPDRRTVLSHAEVEVTLGVKQKGKWDFDYTLFPAKGYTGRDPVVVGDQIRAEISRKLGDLKLPTVAPGAKPTLRRGSTGDDVRLLQDTLNLTHVDGQFGPGTWAAVVDFQSRNNLLPDGVVGRMTWLALGFN